MAVPELENDWQIAKAALNSDLSVAVNKPTGLVEGDLLLLAIAIDNGGGGGLATVTPPSSMTQVQQSLAGAGFVWAEVRGKIAGASEPSTYTYSWTNNTSDGQQAVLFAGRLTGAASTFADAINVSAVLDSGTADATPPSPGLTTTVDDCRILRFMLADSDANFTEDNGYNPASTTEIYARRSDTAAGFGPAQNLLATETKGLAGAVPQRDFSLIAADQYVGITVAIAPAVVTGNPWYYYAQQG